MRELVLACSKLALALVLSSQWGQKNLENQSTRNHRSCNDSRLFRGVSSSLYLGGQVVHTGVPSILPKSVWAIAHPVHPPLTPLLLHCKCLQGFTGWLGGFSAISAGKTCNICRDFPAICKYYRVFPADIAENPRRVPVNPCKHLQCITLFNK